VDLRYSTGSQSSLSVLQQHVKTPSFAYIALDSIVQLFQSKRSDLLKLTNQQLAKSQSSSSDRVSESPESAMSPSLLTDSQQRRGKRRKKKASSPQQGNELFPTSSIHMDTNARDSKTGIDPEYVNGERKSGFLYQSNYAINGQKPADEIVTCPCCSKSVLNKDINLHLSSLCTEYLVKASKLSTKSTTNAASASFSLSNILIDSKATLTYMSIIQS
jgi:hypothetical protein